MSKKGFDVRNTVIISLFAAVCCVCSMISLPIGAVPITLATFGILATTMILGASRAVVSVAVFIAIGIVGLPVFSGFNGGIGVIAGPTGGFVYSYLVMIPIVGAFAKHLDKMLSSAVKALLGCVIAILINYTIGTVHYIIVTDTGFNPAGIWTAFCVCVLPFIPFDIVKAVIAVICAQRLKPLCK